MDRDSITFKVISCHPAHIALSTIPHNIRIQTYEVVIGHAGNTLVEIRDSINGTALKSVAISAPLSCDTARSFWVSWTGLALRVGSGETVGKNELASISQMAVPSVASVALATGYGSNLAEWQITFTNPIPGNIR